MKINKQRCADSVQGPKLHKLSKKEAQQLKKEAPIPTKDEFFSKPSIAQKWAKLGGAESLAGAVAEWKKNGAVGSLAGAVAEWKKNGGSESIPGAVSELKKQLGGLPGSKPLLMKPEYFQKLNLQGDE